MELTTVTVENPDGLNLILGQTHFIKSVEDLHEVLAGSSPVLRFGLAFCEASMQRLVRRSGNDEELVVLAVRTPSRSARGTRSSCSCARGSREPERGQAGARGVPDLLCDGEPARGDRGRDRAGPRDPGRGGRRPPLGVEDEDDVAMRKALLRTIGYKL